MTVYAKDLGFAYGIHLHGREMSVGVAAWKDNSGKLCDDKRTVGGINRRSYPFKYSDQPNVIDQFAYEVRFEIQSEADLAQLRFVRAVGGRLNLCTYERTTEYWKRDTPFTVVKTMRRLALRTITPLPPNVADDLPEIAISGGTTIITEGAGAGHYVVGSPDAEGRVTITLGTATTEFQFDYVPYLYMVDAAISKEPMEKLGQSWTINLIEAV